MGAPAPTNYAVLNGQNLYGIYANYGQPKSNNIPSILQSQAFTGRVYDLTTDFSGFNGGASWDATNGPGGILQVVQDWAGVNYNGSYLTQADTHSASYALVQQLGFKTLNLSVSLIVDPGGAPYTFAKGLTSPYPYDGVFTAVGKMINHYFPTAYLRLGHEFNLGQYPWCIGANNGVWTTGTVAAGVPDYGYFWSHCAALIKAQAPNCKMVWNPAFHQNGIYPTAAYPVDDSNLDVIAVDCYDQNYSGATTMISRWYNAVNSSWGLQQWLQFAASKGKVIAAPEWGVGDGGNGTLKDDSLFMANLLYMFEWAGKAMEYQSYWDFNAGDINSKLSVPSQSVSPKTASIWAAEYQPRAARTVGTGKPSIVQQITTTNGTATLPNATTVGNVLVAVVCADNNNGVQNKNNGFDANLVGLDVGTHRWYKTHGSSTGNRGITVFHRTVNTTNDGIKFVPPAGWTGTIHFMEIANMANISILPGTSTNSGNNTSVNVHVPANSLGLAVVQYDSYYEVSTSQANTTTSDSGLYNNASTVNYGSNIFEIKSTANTLTVNAPVAATPIYSVLMIGGRASAPSSSVPTIVQQNNNGGVSSTLKAAPTVGNTLVAIMSGINNGGQGGVLPPPGWTMIGDRCPDGMMSTCVAMMPVNNVNQTSAAFSAAAGASQSHTIIMEVSGNISPHFTCGFTYPEYGNTGFGSTVTYPITTSNSALNIAWFSTSEGNQWSFTNMANAVTAANLGSVVTLANYASSNQIAVGMVSLPGGMTQITASTPYGLYGLFGGMLQLSSN